MCGYALYALFRVEPRAVILTRDWVFSQGFQWVFFIAFPYIFEKLSYLLMLALFVWFGLSSADWIAVRDALAKPVRDYLQEV